MRDFVPLLGARLVVVVLMVSLSAARCAFAAEEASRIPLRRIVLFNSGVGFFERTAEVDGDVRVDLKFKTDDVNDLLQSMVLEDLGGGAIAPITYTSKEPLARTLETLRVDLSGEPTLADLLAQIRGERVRVEAAEPAEGVIVGVEKNVEQVNDRGIEVKTLNLLTLDGLASIRLADVRRIKLLDEQLDEEFRRALALLAADRADEKKQVTLDFRGKGKRRVRVAYIQESPVWKTSYRLVLRDGQEPFLQGWAIVDNTTEDDWNDVSLTLVSGRPISFVMDLYQSLFVFRAKLQPELFGGLRPQTHDRDLAAGDAELRAKPDAAPFGGGPARSLMGGMAGMGGDGVGGLLLGGREQPESAPSEVNMVPESTPLDLSQGVTSAASGSEVGELFQYAIKMPVTLTRQKSAMLPIVNETVGAVKVSLYNPQSDRRHPLNALELTNTTELHLMQGPITVFDDDAYAGNARIRDLAPGGKRLISYALDLETEIADESTEAPEQLVSVRLAKGVALIAHERRRQRKYVVKNSGHRAKRVMIEQPFDAGWKLAAPQEPAEKTRSLYRFAVEARPGEPAELNVEERRTTRREMAVGELGERLEVFLKSEAVSESVKDALATLAKQQRALADVAEKRQLLEKVASNITAEQSRIRANLAEVDKNSDLYSRYIRKLNTQEDELDTISEKVTALTAEESEKRSDLGEFILGLNLE